MSVNDEDSDAIFMAQMARIRNENEKRAHELAALRAQLEQTVRARDEAIQQQLDERAIAQEWEERCYSTSRQRDEALAMVEQLTRVAKLAVKLRALVPTEIWIAFAHEVDDACDAGVLVKEEEQCSVRSQQSE